MNPTEEDGFLDDVKRASETFVRRFFPEEYPLFEFLWSPAKEFILDWERQSGPDWQLPSEDRIVTAVGASDSMGVNVATLKTILVTAASMKDLASMKGAATLEDVCRIVSEYGEKVEMEHGMQELCESIFYVRYGEAAQQAMTVPRKVYRITTERGERPASEQETKALRDEDDEYLKGWRDSYDIWIDNSSGSVFQSGERKSLSKYGRRFAAYLLARRGALCHYNEIIWNVWGPRTHVSDQRVRGVKSEAVAALDKIGKHIRHPREWGTRAYLIEKDKKGLLPVSFCLIDESVQTGNLR